MSIGKVIIGWRTLPLSDAAEVIMGSSPPGESYNENAEGVPLINGPVEFGEGDFGLTIRRQYTTEPTKLCRAGDLLLCVRGSTTGRTNIAAFEACIGRGVAAIRAKEHQPFLNHFIRTQRQRLFDLGNGSTFPSITQEQLAAVKVPLPPISDQRRLAGILDKADAIQRKRQQTIRLTEELLRSTFLEMFGDPVNNPKRWDVVPLGDVIAEGPQNGLYRPSSDYGSGTLIVRIDTYRGGDVLTTASITKRLRLDRSSQELYLLKDGNLLINRVNSRSHLGKVAVVTNLQEPVVFESNMMRVSLHADRANPLYVMMMLGQPAINRQIQRAAKDAVNQSSINQTDVKNLVLPLPPVSLQRKYAAVHERTLRLREKRVLAKSEHEVLFAALVQRAFRGEL